MFLFGIRKDSFLIKISKHFTSQKIRSDLDQIASYLASLQTKCHCVIGIGAILNILGKMI